MLLQTYEILTQRADFFISLSIEHFVICTICVILALFFGVGLGTFIVYKKSFEKPILTAINFIYTIPSIAMLGLLIPFFGVGNTTAILALSLYALLPMTRSTYSGLLGVDLGLIRTARALGATEFQIFFKISLPLAFGAILSGFRTMVVMTIALAGVASFIGAGGLGVAIYRGITTNNLPMVIAGSLLIAVIALASDFLLGLFEKFKRLGILLLSFAFIFSIFALLINKEQKFDIKIATKPMTEQYILGNMLEILLNQEGLKTSIAQGIGGGTFNIHPSMKSGEFDLYVEYTGTAWSMVLERKNSYENELFGKLKSEYLDKFNFHWIGMYGFGNSYALAVRSDIATKFGLKKISDLAKVSKGLKFGAEYDFFERDDGYKGLLQIYGLEFDTKIDLDIGLKYRAIADGVIDVMPIFTTDGLFAKSNLVVLEDDKKFYPSYMAGNVVRAEILERFPVVRDVLSKVDGILNDKDMATLNYLVEIEGLNPRDVAYDFLRKKKLVK